MLGRLSRDLSHGYRWLQRLRKSQWKIKLLKGRTTSDSDFKRNVSLRDLAASSPGARP